MILVYAVILAFSAGLGTVVLARTVSRLATMLGVEVPLHDVLSYAGLAALAFLMVAQPPTMMLTSALVLWVAGMCHAKTPLSLPVRMGLLVLTVLLGIAALGTPAFNVPEQLPKAAVMFAVYVVWLAVTALPIGAPSVGLLASFCVSLSVFIIGVGVLSLPLSIAGDAVVVMGALIGALMSMTLANSHQGLAGQWVFLYLLGFLAASAAYEGVWWLGLLGLLPVSLYTLARRV